MAKESIALLKGKVDVARVIDELNAALAEEWLAYYQYWTYANVVKGFEREDIKKEFMRHAQEELHHAQELIDRILQLDGTPVMTPQEWLEKARCTYERPTEYDSEYFLKAVRAGEECAMLRYQGIIELTDGKDYITCDLAKHILAEEADHEQDMQDYLDDLEQMRLKINPGK